MSRAYSNRVKQLEARLAGFEAVERYRRMESVPEPSRPPAGGSGVGVAPDSSPWGNPLVRCGALGLSHVGHWIEWIPGSQSLQDNPRIYATIGVLVGIRPDSPRDATAVAPERRRVLVLRQGSEIAAIRVPAIEEITIGPLA